jgi:hypothetical protein
MKHTLPLLACAALVVLQTGCMSSPITASAKPMGYAQWSLLGLGGAAGALAGQSLNDSWGAPAGAALAVAGTAAYLQHASQREAQLVAEAKEEARREERAKLMQSYWVEASGSDYVGHASNLERDVRYDAGVYDGVHYETRSLPRQLYFQEPPR